MLDFLPWHWDNSIFSIASPNGNQLNKMLHGWQLPCQHLYTHACCDSLCSYYTYTVFTYSTIPTSTQTHALPSLQLHTHCFNLTLYCYYPCIFARMQTHKHNYVAIFACVNEKLHAARMQVHTYTYKICYLRLSLSTQGITEQTIWVNSSTSPSCHPYHDSDTHTDNTYTVTRTNAFYKQYCTCLHMYMHTKLIWSVSLCVVCIGHPLWIR